MEEIRGNIKRIKLANGDIYTIFDEGALRLGDVDSEGNAPLLTGNPAVDNIIISTGVSITQVDDVPVTQSDLQVIFRDPTTGKLQKGSLEYAQMRLGIKTYGLTQTGGIL